MQLNHVTIQTANFAKEVDFYKTYANLNVMREIHPGGGNIVFLANAEGQTEVEIIENPQVEAAGGEGISVGFVSGNVEAVREQLIKDGYEPGPFVSPTPDVKFFFVKDPAGVTVQFM